MCIIARRILAMLQESYLGPTCKLHQMAPGRSSTVVNKRCPEQRSFFYVVQQWYSLGVCGHVWNWLFWRRLYFVNQWCTAKYLCTFESLDRQAISAMLEAVAAGHEKITDVLFAWGVAPDLGRSVADLPKPGETHVLILGWGGSNCSQLEAIQKFWRQQGLPTLATTFCFHVIEKQLADIRAFIPPGSDVLVHAFSNNGMYLLQHLCQEADRPWRLAGVIVDSAPDVNISAALMRQVVNGCIRALCISEWLGEGCDRLCLLFGINSCKLPFRGICKKYEAPRTSSTVLGMLNGVVIEKKAEAALTSLNIISPLRVGDSIHLVEGTPPEVADASGHRRGVLLTSRGVADS